MTSKQKRGRKRVIKERLAEKNAAAKEDQADSVRTAESLEDAGKWCEAAIAWEVVADYASTAKAKKSAAERKAAAKVRASAAAERDRKVVTVRELAARFLGEVECVAGYAPPAGEEEGKDEEVDEPDPEREEQDRYIRDSEKSGTSAKDCESEVSGSTDAAGATAIDAENRAEAEEPAAPQGGDPRLPPVGTVLRKLDRVGAERARCSIVEAGVEYASATYKSLSAAGLKAMADLGLKATTCDGYAFWGLKRGAKTARAAKAFSIEPIQKAWDRYLDCARAAGAGASDEDRAKIHKMLAAHADAIRDMAWLTTSAPVPEGA